MSIHTKQFRGYFIPVDVVNLFEDKKINLKEMFLLSLIDSLVSAKGEGCFASNEYLGNKLQLGGDRIKRMISNLKKLGLIKQVKFDGRKRYLETVFSRIISTETELGVTEQMGENEPIGRGEFALSNGVNETLIVNKCNSLAERVSSKKKKERSARVQEPTILSDDNEFDRKQAAMLRSVLIRYNSDLVAPSPPRRPVTLETLRKSITRLRMERNVPKSQIENMLLWLEKHFDDQFTPSINKVDDFYNKWKSFVKVKNSWEIENGDTNVADYNTNTDASRVSTWLQENGWDPWNEGTPDQSLVDQACQVLKIKTGSVSSSEVTV